MDLSQRLKYIVRIVVWGFIGFHIGLAVLLNLPVVQGKLASWVSYELRKILDTEVSVGHVDLGYFNKIHLENVCLKDREGEELLGAGRLIAYFEWAPLFDGKIVINSVRLLDFDVRLKKETPDSPLNCQFVLDAFAPQDTLKESANLDLRISAIIINNGNLKFDVLSAPETPGKFNTSHIGIQNLNATVSLKALRNDTLNAYVRRLRFEEQSGFRLKQLRMKLLADNRHMRMSDFNLELPASSLTMDTMYVRFDSLSNFPEFTDDVTYGGQLTGSLKPADFSPFLPALEGLHRQLALNMEFNGKGKNLDMPLLKISDEKHLNLQCNASLQDWDAKHTMLLKAKLTQLSADSTAISYWMNGLTGNVPPVLKRMEFIKFDGTANGYLHRMTVNGHLQTAVGSLDADMQMNLDKNLKRTYSGGLKGNGFHLGRLLGNRQLGEADFQIRLEGFNYQNRHPESYIKGVVSSLEYSQYRYENILMDGIYKDGGFNGHLALDDENATVRIDGAFNTSHKVSDINLHASVRNFRPHELNLSDKYKDSDISLNLMANFTGSSIDDVNGYVLLDSLVMNAPDDGSCHLDSLKITAETVGGEKEIRIISPFMKASLSGRYAYNTIPASILRIARHYIPSLVTLDNRRYTHLDNNFKFNVWVDNTEVLQKLFFIPLDVKIPASLGGYVSDSEGRLRIEGTFPSLIYDGTQYESGTLLCENPDESMNCRVRGGMLLNSGAMLNLSVQAQAEEDRLKTTLIWGNNTDVTYGGKVEAVTRFFRTEGKRPILQADIDILPTQVVLNDTLWNIRSSHVAVDSGRVYVDNFLFERSGQHLRIDGKITRNPADSCIIDLKNVDVQYVLDIVQFDDIEFGGLATGKVRLKNILDTPDMQTRLSVHNFAVNRGLMGEADIRGVWDNELPGIRLEADMQEQNLSRTRVTGFVSPKLKALDLHIDADSTNLDLLAPYFEGIFSDMDGRATGFVRLHGGFKTLDFEGGVRVNLDTKVDILNTYLQLRNDSVHLRAGEFALHNARIFDREGHTGSVTGALRHTHLKNLTYDFDIQGNNFLMYNTNAPDDMLFYGKVYGTGNISLKGGNNAMDIDANITTGRNTTFTYVTGLTTEAASNQFITFVDKTPRRLEDEIKTEFYHYTDAQKKKEEEGPAMDFRINLFVDVTPDAQMKVIMDPVAGDNINARGNGNFRVSYYNKGDFTMFGNYVIDEGMYKLSMQEIIRKDFALQSGSTVTFAGDPYQANLDVQAVYTVNSVSLSDLSTDAELNQSTVKVNCLMNLTGSLASPTIKFDLELPTVSEEDRELVRSVTSTEEQMNTQIIYLLGIGKFYAYDYNENANQSSNATSSLAFSTLSGQLNNMLSQVMENKNWNIGANFSTGQDGWSDVEAEAVLSGRLLNNRLLINGNFGYRENVMTNTNFVGDFEAVWLLTRNGEFRLRGYNQTNDRYFTKSTLTTQGIGFIYKKDFNIWSDLFQWLMRKKSDKKLTMK